MRVVVDTNVFVSSLLNTEGNPRKVIDLWRFEKITLCISKEILEEYVEVLGRVGLEGTPELKELLDLFSGAPNILFTSKTPEIHAVPDDHDDDKFIACALALEAEVIITGDKALEAVGFYSDIRISNPSRFLADFKRNVKC